MAVHDWTKGEVAYFGDFRQEWLLAIKRALNNGVLPPDHYATFKLLDHVGHSASHPPAPPPVGLSLEDDPPNVRHRQTAEEIIYARPSGVVIRRVRGDAAIAVVTAFDKSEPRALTAFATRAAGLVKAGVSLLVLDLLPPSACDPQGIHHAIWGEFNDRDDFTPPPGLPLTLVSYAAGDHPEAFLEPTAVGLGLPEMPLFLSPEVYILVPLEPAYREAWRAVPACWRERIERPDAAPPAS